MSSIRPRRAGGWLRTAGGMPPGVGEASERKGTGGAGGRPPPRAPPRRPEVRSDTARETDEAGMHMTTSTQQDRPPDGRRALRSPWVWGTAMATVLILVFLVLIGSGRGNGKPTAAPRSGAAPARGPSSPAGRRRRPTRGHHWGRPPTRPRPRRSRLRRPRATGEVESVAGPAEADVSVNECVIDPSDARHAVVNGTVVNHDTHTDDYTITVAIQKGARPWARPSSPMTRWR